MNYVKMALVTLFVAALELAPRGAEVPTVPLDSCEITNNVALSLIDGINGAFQMNAASFLHPNDLGHGHLVMTKESYKNLSKDSYTQEQLMERIEGILFHSRESPAFLKLFPEMVQRYRNIYIPIGSKRVSLIDTDQFHLESPFTVDAEKDLDFVEIYQVNFQSIPRMVDAMKCQLPRMIIRGPSNESEEDIQIGITKIIFIGAGNGRFKTNNILVRCSCTGDVETLPTK